MSAPARPPGPALPAGGRLGPYALGAVIGRGGMGAVYRAVHAQTGATHAVKVILASRLAGNAERALARFRREAEVLARIDAHPAVVPVHTFGIHEGVPWCAMDYIDGESLASRLRLGPMRPLEAARLVATLARAVAHVHRHEVVHRDLKPENVLIDAAGAPHIVDFGLAYDAFAEQLTRTGECVGTPAYMAPEQVRGRAADGDGAHVGVATDVYGLGAILYAVLTGRPPFEAETPLATIAAVVKDDPVPPRRGDPTIPGDVEAVCLRALRKAPEERYPDADAMAADLEAVARGEGLGATASRVTWSRLVPRWLRPRTRGGRVAAGALGVALLVAALALAAGRRAVDPAGRIAAARGALAKGAPLGERELAALAELAADASDPIRAREVAVTMRLAALLDDGAAPRPDDARALAELVRPAGAVNRSELLEAVRLLHRAGRFDALAVVLHGVAPAEPAPFEIAGDLARAIAAASGDAVPPPDDDRAMKALLRAQVDDAVRGRLLVRRATRALARDGEEDRATALADLLAAFEDHRTPPGAQPASFQIWCVERFLEKVAARDPDSRALCDLIIQMERAPEALLPVGLVLALQQAAGVSSLMGDAVAAPTPEDAVRLLEIGAVLESWGDWPLDPSDLGPSGHAIGLERLRRLAAEEAGRPASQRNPARLFLLAEMIRIESDGDREFLRSFEAASESAVRRPYSAIYGVRYNWMGDHIRWLELMKQWLELDRRQPLGHQSVFLREKLGAHHVRWPSERTPTRERLVLAAGYIAEAAPILAASSARSEQIRELGGSEAWHRHAGLRGVVDVTLEVIDAMTALGPPDCCGGDGTGLPSLEDLLAGVSSQLDHPKMQIGLVASIPGEELFGPHSVALRRSAHHASHERFEQALACLDQDIDVLREMTDAVRRLRGAQIDTSLAELLDQRARVLVALGRRKEARAARLEANALLGRQPRKKKDE